MICPACNCELSAYREFCENCGAPTYLAAAIQTAELTHCTYCGTREQVGYSFCPVCGLKKNYRLPERVVGICRNCGTAWKKGWLYCQTCGVARENGLVEMTMPVQPLAVEPLSGKQPHVYNALESLAQQPPITEPYEDSLSPFLPAYFLEEPNSPDEIPPSPVENEDTEPQKPAAINGQTTSLNSSENATAEPAENLSPEADNTTIVSEEVASSGTAPVQAVSVSDKPRADAGRSWGKHCITIIIVLVGLLLLFAALNAFDIKLEALYGRPRSRNQSPAQPSRVPTPGSQVITAPTGMVYIPVEHFGWAQRTAMHLDLPRMR